MSIFCFDLDETLVRGDIITQASRMLAATGKIDKIYTGKDVTSWTLDGVPECVKEKSIELFSDPHYAVWNKIVIVGVKTFLHYLKAKKHILYITTARFGKLHEDTKQYVAREFGDAMFEEIVCVDGYTQGKIMELAKINPDFYFDDNIDYCEEARLLGIDTYMISNEHTPWNHKIALRQITSKEINEERKIIFINIIENKKYSIKLKHRGKVGTLFAAIRKQGMIFSDGQEVYVKNTKKQSSMPKNALYLVVGPDNTVKYCTDQTGGCNVCQHMGNVCYGKKDLTEDQFLEGIKNGWLKNGKTNKLRKSHS